MTAPPKAADPPASDLRGDPLLPSGSPGDGPCDTGGMEEHIEEQEGEYYGEVYGSDDRFEWFWWGATWLTVPLFAAYLIYRLIT